MTPLLKVPSEIEVILTLPGGVTGDPLLAKIPAPANAASVRIGAAPVPAAKWPYDQIPWITNDPLAIVVSDVVTEVVATGAVFVTKASG